MADKKYEGMTVNERLFISGNLTAFDQAILDKDVEIVKSILKLVELDQNSIQDILEYYNLG